MTIGAYDGAGVFELVGTMLNFKTKKDSKKDFRTGREKHSEKM